MNLSERPQSLRQIAKQSVSNESFGYALADFEHELAGATSRPELLDAIRDEPPLLTGKFDGGAIADSWLAAIAELLAFHYRLRAPDWVWQAPRFLSEPIIHDAHSARLKVWHVLKSAPAFSRRNYFVDYQLPPIHLRRGRPRKSDAHKRLMNRKRVARHRAKQAH